MVETTRLLNIAEAVSLLPEGAAFGEPEFDVADVGRVLTEHKVTPLEFRLLDDTPGRLGYDLGNGRGWHWKLRRWRNTGGLREHKFPQPVRCKRCGANRTRSASGRLRPCDVEGCR